MASNFLFRNFVDRAGKAEILEFLSMSIDGNVFESWALGRPGPASLWLHVTLTTGLTQLWSLVVGRGLVSLETAVNDALDIQTREVCDAVKRRAFLADRRVGRERNSAATPVFEARENRQRRCSQITETNTRSTRSGFDRHLQISRSRTVLTHSRPQTLPPYMP